MVFSVEGVTRKLSLLGDKDELQYVLMTFNLEKRVSQLTTKLPC